MVIEPLTDRECRAILAETNLARLGCALDNQPYVVPIHVDFHDAYLYGFAMLGKKIEWMRQNPLVCLEMDHLKNDWEWVTVLVFGSYEELPDIPDYQYPRSVAQRLFERHPLWWEPCAVPLAGRRESSRILFRILITHMSGRRARPDAAEAGHPGEAPEARRPRRLAHVLHRVLGRS